MFASGLLMLPPFSTPPTFGRFTARATGLLMKTCRARRNVGSVISFRVGESDAEALEKEFGGAFTASQFVSLGKHQVFVKLLCDGEWTEPFLGKTLPPPSVRYDKGETIIKRSRQFYGTKRWQIESKIRRWRGDI